jgi:lipid-A-disaccharide synthase-like uncharacterized protein
VKWEPALAMAGVLALGVWLVAGPGTHPGLPEPRPGAHTIELRIGNDKGVLEVLEEPPGTRTYRMLFRDGAAGPVLTEEQMRAALPAPILERAAAARTNWVFRALNITTWASLVWVCLGFAGQLVFSCRFLVQWIISEKKRQSTVPEVFWWLSLSGGVLLFTYFVWRQDIVGVLGQSSGLVIYARNIRLIAKKRRRDRTAAERAGAETDPPGFPRDDQIK